MLDALRHFGKSVSPADLSAATLAAGTQSIATSPTYTNLGADESLKYAAPVKSLTNQDVIPMNTELEHYSLISQNQLRLALSQNSLLPIHNGNDAGGRKPIAAGIQSF